MEKPFGGRVALVTGAGRGLGRAYAELLAWRGARVVVNDLDEGEDSPAQETVQAIRAKAGEAIAIPGSITAPGMPAALVERALEAFGRIDILINNAGFLRDRSFRSMTLEDLDSVIDVHLRAAAHITHAVWPHLYAQGYGRILFTTSTSGLYGMHGQANYDAAKLGLIGLQNALKLEGRSRNILVNSIAPLAATRLADAAFPPELQQRMGLHWVAEVALALVAEPCSHSGLVLEVGGNHLARARIVENDGVRVAEPTPESAMRAIAEAASGGAERGFDSAPEAVAKILGFGS
ncbi:SDR family NAD(P)-dependent oxidoreductase [Sandaracinobacter neustonicus]|uniref:SDR family NAD(P)-dependent oxidoreductase n=1 Tax=Sandaracinobacter neustonicus TaxID=1715348 RepID=A0A501XJ62_9SPHN|nr:SDR family NAD(P)-dependent oxidoreductase [Sandaracinobacter neustonicus]TPE60485.1 SDR family NAD(P)-dependent oxidoreductase [Sandaracinobacter neustonicus]